jgi:hypothetical protein
VFFVFFCGGGLEDRPMGWLATKGHKAHKRLAALLFLWHSADRLDFGGTFWRRVAKAGR